MLRMTFWALAVVAVAQHAWAQDQAPNDDSAASEASLAAPDEGGPRRWQVAAPDGIGMQASPGLDAPVIALLADGAILSNLGCEPAAGGVWCKVRPLRGRARGYVAATFLQPARAPDGTVPMGVDNSALRATQGDFDAGGILSCAQSRGQPMRDCAFGVARGTGGDATVVVTFSNGFTRKLFFVHGLFISADATMSGTGFDTDWRTEGDLHFIRVDDQRYAVPVAAIVGG
ncbi:SH3 domain-containing protein [Algihabitans albus]|uniref:hypothetical protein n=1 Tax=Algihabitans albus TaxID=2164067 RepID=UPI000E5C7F15|nr:hypothetical protein [Algihabitans albus]